MCRSPHTEIPPLLFGSTYSCNFGRGLELRGGAAVIQPLTQAPNVSCLDDCVGHLVWKEHREKRKVILLETKPLSTEDRQDKARTRRGLCTLSLSPVNRAPAHGTLGAAKESRGLARACSTHLGCGEGSSDS